jgi:MFS family permease
MTSAAFWRAWSIWAVTMAMTAASGAYNTVNPLPAKLANQGGSGANWVVALVFVAAFATVGAVLAWKRPENPIGWLLSASGLAYSIGIFGLVLSHFSGTLTLANWLGWTWFVGLGLCVFVVLLFPTGHLPSRRWRPVAWAAGAGVAGWVLGNAFAPTILSNSPSPPNPVGVPGPAGDIFKVMAASSEVLIAATGLAAIVSLAFRYRRAGTPERAQLKWLVYAGALIVVALLAEIPAEQILGTGDAATNLQNAVSSGAIALVPVAIGIAILRYRLYDIDRVISRTVAYAILTGLLVGVYAGLVLLATQVLGLHSTVGVAAATLVAAALFNPVRRRVQKQVDRRFNRARYDAERTVAAFATRLKDAVDLDAVRDDLAEVVQTTLEPAHLWMWTQDQRRAPTLTKRLRGGPLAPCAAARAAAAGAYRTCGRTRGSAPPPASRPRRPP